MNTILYKVNAMFGKIIALLLTLSALTIVSGCNNSQQKGTTDVIYYSESGDELEVIYHIEESSVTVIQPNGKQITLPQAMAASGIRYTKDEKTVFWSKGVTAQFYVDDKLVFQGAEKE